MGNVLSVLAKPIFVITLMATTNTLAKPMPITSCAELQSIANVFVNIEEHVIPIVHWKCCTPEPIPKTMPDAIADAHWDCLEPLHPNRLQYVPNKKPCNMIPAGYCVQNESGPPTDHCVAKDATAHYSDTHVEPKQFEWQPGNEIEKKIFKPVTFPAEDGYPEVMQTHYPGDPTINEEIKFQHGDQIKFLGDPLNVCTFEFVNPAIFGKFRIHRNTPLQEVSE